MDSDSPPDQQTYVIQTLRATWDALPVLLFGSLLFTIAWLPSLLLNVWGRLGAGLLLAACITAPAWTGLLELEAAILQRGRASIHTMPAAIRRYASRSVRLGILLIVPIFISLWSLPWLDHPDSSLSARLVLSVAILAALIFFTFCLYAFPLLVLSEQSAFSALRNGSILAGRHPINTLGLLGMFAIFSFAVTYLSMALLFFLPALFGMFVVNNCRMLLAAEQLTSPEINS